MRHIKRSFKLAYHLLYNSSWKLEQVQYLNKPAPPISLSCNASSWSQIDLSTEAQSLVSWPTQWWTTKKEEGSSFKSCKSQIVERRVQSSIIWTIQNQNDRRMKNTEWRERVQSEARTSVHTLKVCNITLVFPTPSSPVTSNTPELCLAPTCSLIRRTRACQATDFGSL